MKVTELIRVLSQYHPDTLATMSSDPEGNSYSPIAGAAGNLFYEPESNWSGVVFDEGEWRDNYGDEPMPESIVSTVVLWPKG
jgi:hypothetical protein